MNTSLCVLYEMMNERKYELEIKDENMILFKKITTSDENKNKVVFDEDDGLLQNNDDKIIVFFPVENKVNIDTIKEILYKMEKVHIKNCIIVYKESITSSAKKTLDVLELNIEMFHLEQLQYNITKHNLVPKHIRIEDKQQKKELLKKYGTQLPVLLKSDAVSRFYNYKKGDLIKILRTNNTICYRLVL